MVSHTSFVAQSHKLHRELTQRLAGRLPSIIDAPESIDAYMHFRDYSFVEPIVRAYSDKVWMTVGDMGADAYYLATHGVKKVIASSLDDSQLRAVADAGYLDGINVLAVNAEDIPLADDSVDFVFVKGTFHHLPRPMLGFYELLRVARAGVIFLEPADGPVRLLDFLRKVAKRILRGQHSAEQEFEPIGNFIYRLSIKEISKALCALQFGELAYRPLNVFYMPALRRYSQTSYLARWLFHLGCGIQDILCWLHLMTPGSAICYVSKLPIPGPLRAELGKKGFRWRPTPMNPYLKVPDSK